MTRRIKDFSLHIHEQLGRTVWALAADVDGTTAVVVKDGVFERATDTPTRSTIIMTVVDTIRATEPSTTEVDLFVFDTATRKMLLDMGGSFDTIQVLTKSQMTHVEGWDRFGWRRCRELLGLGDDGERWAESARVIDAATDGSVSRAGVASYAWIRDDGRFGMDNVRTTDILVAELTAVHAILTDAEPTDILRISVDSKAAITCIMNEPGFGRSKQSSAVEAILRNIASIRARRAPFELLWVKGHNGHPLNDGADRLARLSREAAGPVNGQVKGSIARNIVEDALTNHRQTV
jgi:ribonuclease HI